jgi:hexosaminidase
MTLLARSAAAVLAASLLGAAAPVLAQDPLGVIPAPAAVELRPSGAFLLDGATMIVVPADDAEARRAAEYFADLMRRTRGLDLQVTAGAEPARGVVFRRGAAEADGYALTVADDRVTVAAGDFGGLLYGGISLWQLATASAEPGPIRIPAAAIQDAPRFAWRGVMLDSARHYQSPEFIKTFIDWMVVHKLNVFHWHLTDDQGWRLEIKRYPRLTEVGAWRVPAGAGPAADIDPATGRPRLYGGFYTQDQVREIVAYAQARNIVVVPEIDVPGHASAAIAAYPELAVIDAPGSAMPAVPADWGVYPNLFNTEDSTLTFLENVLDEVMDLFPGEYVHLGGDEAVKDQWKASPRTQARMREVGAATENEMQSWFIGRLERHLNAHGRRMIGWDEILEGGLAPNATVMSWRGVAGAVEAARLGHDTVMAPAPTLYLDNRQSAADGAPGRGEVVSLERIYAFDPTPAEMTAEQSARVLGLQATLFTEHMRTEDRVEYMTFPRLAAVAEVAWSDHDRLDWNGFRARLQPQLARYRALGIDYAQIALAPDADPLPADGARRYDHQLKLCSAGLVLSLIDDAPLTGERPALMMDIMNPCWIYQQADLTRGATLRLAVGQVPFNFQIGADRDKIRLARPRTPEGELEVFVGACEGEPALVIPLAGAAASPELSILSGRLPPSAGRHDLCLRFAQHGLDPMWGVDWVELEARP